MMAEEGVHEDRYNAVTATATDEQRSKSRHRGPLPLVPQAAAYHDDSEAHFWRTAPAQPNSPPSYGNNSSGDAGMRVAALYAANDHSSIDAQPISPVYAQPTPQRAAPIPPIIVAGEDLASLQQGQPSIALENHLDAVIDGSVDNDDNLSTFGRYLADALPIASPPPSAAISPASATYASGASHNAVAWANTVPAELLAALSKDEVKRQNAILELIQKEEEFLHDLELLDSLFLTNLLASNVVKEERERDSFIREVFLNHTQMTALIRTLVELLHERQREDGPVVQHVGDIYLQTALGWADAFEVNMIGFPMAKQRVQREAMLNPLFATFLEECRMDPACHRLPMDHFLQRATTRLPRYNLHFKTILKDTDAENSDRDSLQRAIELVDEQCKSIQKGVAAAETKVKIREYAYNLASKRNKVAIHMDLLNPERQLVHQNRVYRKPDFTDFEWQDLQAALFDNYLVVTKLKTREEGDRSVSRFVLEKRPIAVEMMQLSGFNDAPVSRSLGLSNLHLRSDRENRDLFPFTISHIAGKMEPLTLYAATKTERDEWKTKIDEAVGLRSAVQEANRLFDISPITSDLFAIPPPAASLDPLPVSAANVSFHGVVTCAIPFCTRDGRRLIAIGCADGVWIGLRNDAKSLRKVLHLKLVMQCAVLEEFGIFVVLADKILISYSLDALVPSAFSQNDPRPPQKLSGNRDVVFFAVGKMKERTLLVYVKRKPNESVFRALEPLAVGARGESESSGHGGLFSRFGSNSKSSGWFREYKTFFIPSEAYSMQFLRSKLCIVCARGFEIIDLDNLIPGTIPDFSLTNREDPRIYTLSRRVEAARPLGMFKNREGEFLLCYDGFACFVDRRGYPIKLEQIIEWEGVPHSVAFKEPFILAFDARFIEVRDSVSGQLVQLIRTQELRNVSFSSTTISDDDEAVLLTQRLRSAKRTAYDCQQVFELVGTPTYVHHIRMLEQSQSQQGNDGSLGSAGGSGNAAAFYNPFSASAAASAAGSFYDAASAYSTQSTPSSLSPTLRRHGTTTTLASSRQGYVASPPLLSSPGGASTYSAQSPAVPPVPPTVTTPRSQARAGTWI